MTQLHTSNISKMPRHVAVIMDGNGRWAKARGLDRSEGHVEGVNTVRRIAERASNLGIEYLTLYTFSTENWHRPQAEVDALMHLISIAIKNETPDLIRNNIRLSLIGDLKRIPAEALDSLNECVEATSRCTGMTLCLALSYSSRWEMADAVKRIAAEALAGNLDLESINADTLSDHLTTAGMPDPDLLIRTGGDHRISNFLLYQIAYSELSFINTFWPDFTADEFEEAVRSFGNRERRFGLTSDQLK